MKVVCFKVGDDTYTYEHVNKLYEMIARNTSHKFDLVCFTEDTRGIKTYIDARPLPEERLNGWWNRLSLFKKGVLSGPCINIDLDVVIHNNIDELFELDDELYMVPNGVYGNDEYNDCVVKFNPDKHHYMWDKFIADKSLYHAGGVDRFMTMLLKLGEHKHKTFPREWFSKYSTAINDRLDIHKNNKFCHFIKLSQYDRKQHELRDHEFVKKYWV
tara:strand:+ start:546 stop:1190 length:645 start_codon:yes stop_codon:yes gene_type:complete